MNLDELRKHLQSLLSQRDEGSTAEAVDVASNAIKAREADIDDLLDTCRRDGGRNLLASEQRAFETARSEITELRTMLDTAERRAARLAQDRMTEVGERRAAVVRLEERIANGAPPAWSTVRIGGGSEVYREGGPSFFADAYAAFAAGDPQAQARLAQHSASEQRAIGTPAMVGLVPPAYLTDQVVAIARAGRPFANIVRRLPLPAEGMTVNLSRITTGSTVASQDGENVAVSNTNMDDTLLTIDVRTIAGQQDISRQLFERSAPGTDGVIFADLAAAYSAELNRQALLGTGSNGEMLGALATPGIQTVTYTDASPTVPEVFPKLADAVQKLQTGIYAGPSHIVMHPRRWAWFLSALDPDGRPLVTPAVAGPANAYAVATSTGYGEQAGTLLGLPVVTDAAIPTNLGAGTNEDTILVVAASELFLWEDNGGTPFTLRFEQTTAGSLTIKLVAYGYAAFTAGRYPKATVAISGTGLVAPAFA